MSEGPRSSEEQAWSVPSIGALGAIVVGAAGLYVAWRRYAIPPAEPRDMVGRTVVITGANTGLGYATAQRLIARGARVIVSCRSGAKCTATAKSLGGAPVAVCGPPLELQDLVSVRTFARYIEGLREPVHALVNNAGGMMPSRVGVPMIGEDGSTTEVEATFAANCVGPAALTLELLPVLARSGEHGRAARVVTVASKLEKGAQLDAFLSDVSGRSNAGLSKPGEAGAAASFDTWVAYANSKQGNIHATVALADAFRASNVPVTAVVVTPGMVNTDLGRQFSWFGLTAPLRWLLLPSSHAGAEATIYAVTSRHIEGESGVYYGKNRKTGIVGEETPSAAATDSALTGRVWSAICRIIQGGTGMSKS